MYYNRKSADFNYKKNIIILYIFSLGTKIEHLMEVLKVAKNILYIVYAAQLQLKEANEMHFVMVFFEGHHSPPAVEQTALVNPLSPRQSIQALQGVDRYVTNRYNL